MDSTFWVADWRDGELFKLGGGGIFSRVLLFEWFGDSVDDDGDDDDFEVGVDLFVVSDGGCSNVVAALGDGSVIGDGGESA